jgi:hypothetical protein
MRVGFIWLTAPGDEMRENVDKLDAEATAAAAAAV